MFIYLVPIILAVILAVLFEIYSIEKGISLSGKYLYGFIFLLLALFGGLRFETGQDWIPYQAYFERIDLSYGPIESYFSNLANLQFELGYFILNYYIKLIGLNYPFVFLISSLFCAYTVYRFTKEFVTNKFYILAIYISYSFIILHFAQVRQSIAIGFFLLGCTSYIKNEKKLRAILISLVGLLFQFSAFIYIVILLLVFFFPKKLKYRLIVFTLIPILFIITQSLGLYFIIKLFTPESLGNKIDIYEEEQTIQGQGQLIYGAYLAICMGYIYYNMRFLLSEEQLFICKYALFSLLLTILAIFIFPGNYVMYSRLYVLASIFQAYSIALILNIKHSVYHKLFFLTSIIIAAFFYVRILNTYSDEYLPYKFVIEGLFQPIK